VIEKQGVIKKIGKTKKCPPPSKEGGQNLLSPKYESF